MIPGKIVVHLLFCTLLHGLYARVHFIQEGELASMLRARKAAILMASTVRNIQDPYLNRPNGHVNHDLSVSDLFQGGHGMPYIIKVFDWSAETLRHLFNKGEYFFHFCSIANVTVSTKRYAPGSCLCAQRCFQVFCEGNSK